MPLVRRICFKLPQSRINADHIVPAIIAATSANSSAMQSDRTPSHESLKLES